MSLQQRRASAGTGGCQRDMFVKHAVTTGLLVSFGSPEAISPDANRQFVPFFLVIRKCLTKDAL